MRFQPNWQLRMVINGFGAVCTGVVVLVFAVTKFTHGAWAVLVITPVLVIIFLSIHAHYRALARRLSLDDYVESPQTLRHRVILPIGGVHKGSLMGLSYARLLSDDVTAVHVSTDVDETERLQRKWEEWGEGVRLVILESPYRRMLEPLLEYIQELEAKRQPNEQITVVVPQFVPSNWWANLLHMQTAVVLRLALMFRPGIVITDVPYHVD